MEDVPAVIAAMRENMDGETITPFDLARIKMPTGGGTAWSVPTRREPDGEMQKTIEGIIVHSQKVRSYYIAKMGEGESANAPPDCKSDDAKVGEGDPGRMCAECALSKWDGDERPRCKLKQNLFILTDRSFLPIVIEVSPGSLKPIKKFMLDLSGEGMNYAMVRVDLGLEKAQSQGGIDYARLTLTEDRVLNDEETMKGDQYRELIGPAFAVRREEVPF